MMKLARSNHKLAKLFFSILAIFSHIIALDSASYNYFPNYFSAKSYLFRLWPIILFYLANLEPMLFLLIKSNLNKFCSADIIKSIHAQTFISMKSVIFCLLK